MSGNPSPGIPIPGEIVRGGVGGGGNHKMRCYGNLKGTDMNLTSDIKSNTMTNRIVKETFHVK